MKNCRFCGQTFTCGPTRIKVHMLRTWPNVSPNPAIQAGLDHIRVRVSTNANGRALEPRARALSVGKHTGDLNNATGGSKRVVAITDAGPLW